MVRQQSSWRKGRGGGTTTTTTEQAALDHARLQEILNDLTLDGIYSEWHSRRDARKSARCVFIKKIVFAKGAEIGLICFGYFCSSTPSSLITADPPSSPPPILPPLADLSIYIKKSS